MALIKQRISVELSQAAWGLQP